MVASTSATVWVRMRPSSCGVDDSGRQIAFYAGVEGSEAEHATGVEQGILSVISEVAANGADPAALEAALDRIELAQRDVGGDGYPYGLQLMSRVLPGAMYQRDPVALRWFYEGRKKDTPEPIVEALNKALAKVMFDSELRSTLIAMGQELATPLRLDDAAKVYADEIRLYQGIARAINLQAQ